MGRDITNQLHEAQQLEAHVTGPDGANRLYLCYGFVWIRAGLPSGDAKEIYTFRLGPQLGRRQFIRAIATASLGGITEGISGTPTGAIGGSILSVQADWDDESGQVEVRIEFQAFGSKGSMLVTENCSYQVAILAEV